MARDGREAKMERDRIKIEEAKKVGDERQIRGRWWGGGRSYNAEDEHSRRNFG